MSDVKQVKEATDIVQVIGERIQLQRSGSSLRGLCPFHSEKSPSFFVSEQFQRFKCFGCGESGDVFEFLQKYDSMTFQESLEYLAQRAGITLTAFQPSGEDELRQRLHTILNLAKEYYHYLLTQHDAGEQARQYLKERGVTAESIKIFQLGFAMSAWDGLVTYLQRKKKLRAEDIVQAGLAVQGKTGRIYDRFRGRIMFPLLNHRGQVVGFSGRVLKLAGQKPAVTKTTGKPAPEEAKYINTPETLLYHKSSMLYGLSELHQFIRQKREAIVTEGEFDVISSAQAHVNNVVAIKGSALTEDHVRLLKRTAERVIFSLDMDDAGVKATKRAIEVVGDEELEMRVIVLPNGKDPDELARTQPDQWRAAVKSSISIYDFLIQASLRQHDPVQPEGKRAIIDDLAPVLGSITHAVEQDVYFKKVAQVLNVKEELVRKDVERFRYKKGRGAAPTPKAQPEKTSTTSPLSRRQRLETYIWFLWLHTPAALLKQRALQLAVIDWEQPRFKLLMDRWQVGAFESIEAFQAVLPADLQQVLFELSAQPDYLEGLESLKLDEEWQKTLTDLKAEGLRQDLQAIQRQLAELDTVREKTPEQETQQTALLQQIVVLQQKLGAASFSDLS